MYFLGIKEVIVIDMSGKDSLQIAMAVITCRLSRLILRGLNRGGTSLPGKLAMRFRRDILAVTSQGVDTILVTGTNGKTTTAGMLAHAMEEAGRAPLCNRSGANLLSGVTAEFTAAADLHGRPMRGRKIWDQLTDADGKFGKLAVIECDEGALRQVAPLLKPCVIVVTNLFRDQLDRYGEVMHTLDAVREGIRLAPEAVLCLNADDSLVASLAMDVPNPVIWFGLEETAVKTDSVVEMDPPERISDARYCVRCGGEYTYRYHTYAHLGDFCCPDCGFARTAPDVAVTSIDEINRAGSLVHMLVPGKEAVPRKIVPQKTADHKIVDQKSVPQEIFQQEITVKIALPAVYNIYILVKNPAGCNQALDYLCTLKEPCTIVLCLNDLDADGHDISWIWDVDYEKLCGCGNIRRVLVWGKRAEDLQLRLKYAGFEEKRIRRIPEKELKKLLDEIYKSQVPVVILPNYTAMLPLRDALRRAAGKDSFWKG